MPAAASIRVLVVDDQLTMRGLTRSTLNQLGFTDISDAGDGEEAFRSLAIKPVQLVISDYNMPKMDGLGLLQPTSLELQFDEAHVPGSICIPTMRPHAACRPATSFASKEGCARMILRSSSVQPNESCLARSGSSHTS